MVTPTCLRRQRGLLSAPGPFAWFHVPSSSAHHAQPV